MTQHLHLSHTSTSLVWLDVISAVDYLFRGHRPGLTVYDTLEEALRWHTAALVAGYDEELAIVDAGELPWDDPDALRTALERLVLHHPPAADEQSMNGPVSTINVSQIHCHEESHRRLDRSHRQIQTTR